MSVSDRTKNLITLRDSVIRVLTLTMFRHEGQERDTAMISQAQAQYEAERADVPNDTV